MRTIRLTFAALLTVGVAGCESGPTLPNHLMNQPAFDDGGVFTMGGGSAAQMAPHFDGVFTMGGGARSDTTTKTDEAAASVMLRPSMKQGGFRHR